jgi:hypothetical protein
MSDILSSISAYSIVVPIVAGLLYFRQFDRNSFIMFFLILLAGVPQLASGFLSGYKYRAFTMELYNFYSLADPLIWAVLFFRNISNRKLRNIVAFIPFAQLVLWVLLASVKKLDHSLFKEMICITSVVQVLWVTVYFYEQYKSYEISRIELKPMFWFCLGILIYAPTTYFLFVFYDQIHDPHSKNYYLWNIHSVVNSLMYCIISVGFYMNKKNEFNFS